MNIYRQHAHNRSIGWSTWHLQWCTKYRYKIFGSIERRNLCKILLCEVANKHNISVLDCEVDVDHVHVVASLPLTMMPLYAVQILKGMTAKGLFAQYPQLRILYKKGHIWSPGKFVGSIGHITLDKAKEYLKAHHAKSAGRNPCSEAAAEESPEGRAFRPGRTSIVSLVGKTAVKTMIMLMITCWHMLMD